MRISDWSSDVCSSDLQPFQGGELRIAEPGAAGVGEIQLRGPNVFAGYRDNPVANRQAFTEDGWFRTGDLGCLDADGFLLFKGRQKELIDRKSTRLNSSH